MVLSPIQGKSVHTTLGTVKMSKKIELGDDTIHHPLHNLVKWRRESALPIALLTRGRRRTLYTKRPKLLQERIEEGGGIAGRTGAGVYGTARRRDGVGWDQWQRAI